MIIIHIQKQTNVRICLANNAFGVRLSDQLRTRLFLYKLESEDGILYVLTYIFCHLNITQRRIMPYKKNKRLEMGGLQP